ncbi:hypothetical protein GCM10020001_016480 [Nonomuraea salmonea]
MWVWKRFHGRGCRLTRLDATPQVDRFNRADRRRRYVWNNDQDTAHLRDPEGRQAGSCSYEAGSGSASVTGRSSRASPCAGPYGWPPAGSGR